MILRTQFKPLKMEIQFEQNKFICINYSTKICRKRVNGRLQQDSYPVKAKKVNNTFLFSK